MAPPPATDNRQDLIFPDHPVWSEWRDLFTLAGRALPSSAAPLSRREMALYLESLPAATSEVETQLRERVRQRLSLRPLLSEGSLRFQFTSVLSPEIYVGTVDRPVDWAKRWTERPPAWRGDFLFQGGETWAFGFDFPLAQEPFAVLDRPGPLATNVIGSLGEWNKYFPFRGWIAAGGDFWSLQWGRGKLSYGPGRTGNLILSDAADFADFVALSLFWKSFKFHTVVINQDWYAYLEDPPGTPARHPSGWYRSAEGAQAKSRFHTFHRLEFRPSPQWSLGLTEAAAVETSGMDFRFLNPLFIYHNWFLSENSDSNAALDWEWTPSRGLTLYGALLADYITTPYKDQVFNDPRPLAFGLQQGAEALLPLGRSLIRLRGEWVHLSPYAYTDRNFNWVQWRRHLSDYGEIRGRALLEQPLGYVLGPDSTSLLGAISWEWPGALALGAEARWTRKGPNHLLTRNPTHPQASDPPLEPPPYEEPSTRWHLRTWALWDLETVGLPPFWTLRADAYLSHISTAAGDRWILQAGLGAWLELDRLVTFQASSNGVD